jgi:hypothetical protein
MMTSFPSTRMGAARQLEHAGPTGLAARLVGDHDAVVPNGPPIIGAEVLESPPSSIRWRERWALLPRRRRRLLAAAAVLLVALAGAAQVRARILEQAAALRVVVAVSLGVEASDSASGGRVDYLLRVRNDGSLPLSVMSLRALSGPIRLQLLGGGQRVGAGREVTIPMSVRLTCDANAESSEGPLNADLVVRRADGGSTSQHVPLRPAGLVRGVAATLCLVRPRLHDYELSGPIAQGG